ncbi:MAG: Fic family protein [gamma proteobacterium endosymbiont of Lamellibrachia anaximandri]|nr:Fic family protein [gamma proteobacterium endosymbiont of Lamellibrachia anaximandri]MBL3618368.1 Fic family protein [gamma proteobacterium endosymbiont of Lamellibrachia anaximandri]
MDLRSLSITPELLRLISEIDEFKGCWSAKEPQNPDRLQVLRHVATIESIGSSTRIEGSKLSDSDIEDLLSQVGKTSFLTRDEQEVTGYAEVMEMMFDNYGDIPITENHIKQLHSILLRHSEKDARHRGEYKKHSNNVEAFDPDGESLGVVFETTTPFDTPGQMHDLLEWTRGALEDKSYHALIVIAIFNVVFLAIHPFQDGNGRLSRVLVSLLLLKAGYSYIQYASLESIVEKNKDAYYLALQRTQKTLKQDKTDWLPWMTFFLRSLKRQKDHLAKKTEALSQYPELPHESMLIMQYVDIHYRITIRDAEKLIQTVSRPTIKNRLSDLVERGLLVRHGKARGTWYAKSE